MPDLNRARSFIDAYPAPGALLLCGLTGSHFHGFPSHDSDVDLKGIHLAPTLALLGLTAPPETHDALEFFEGVEHDLTTHEAGKALGLLLRGNGNMLEQARAETILPADPRTQPPSTAGSSNAGWRRSDRRPRAAP